MPLRNAEPLHWIPRGVSDAVDGTNAFPGAMNALQDLIPDSSTKGVLVCRPAAIDLQFSDTNLNGALISCMLVIGDVAYGLAPSLRYPGYDEPFVFNIPGRTVIPVSGVTASNIPLSPTPTGDWQTPTLAPLSHYIMVTHPGFVGAANGFVGWFDFADPNAPAWNSGNVSGHPFYAPPAFVSVLGGRAYYAIGNATVFSDVQFPLVVTNANQVLTFGSSTPISALAGMPLNNLLGGVLQCLMVFKESEEGSAIYQVTGDYTGIPSALSVNRLNVSGGTAAPNTICSTPYGLAFIDHDGLRLLDLSGNLSDPIGANGDGVAVPFQYAVNKTRMCAAFNRNVYRVSVQNGKVPKGPLQEYWYDFNLKTWTGPHSFPVALIEPWRDSFIAANALNDNYAVSRLWRTDVRPSPLSSYHENGAQLTFMWKTVLLPDSRAMRESMVNQTNIEMAFVGGLTKPTILAEDTNGSIIGQVIIDPSQGPATLWGAFNWGEAVWGGQGLQTSLWGTALWGGANWEGDVSNMSPWGIYWAEQLVFRQMSVIVTGTSSPGFRIGNMSMNVQRLGYRQQLASGVN